MLSFSHCQKFYSSPIEDDIVDKKDINIIKKEFFTQIGKIVMHFRSNVSDFIPAHISVVVKDVVETVSLDCSVEFSRLIPFESDGVRGDVQNGEISWFTWYCKTKRNLEQKDDIAAEACQRRQLKERKKEGQVLRQKNKNDKFQFDTFYFRNYDCCCGIIGSCGKFSEDDSGNRNK